jgi:L-seryl-tRNA(Ser) seleniumtransferase
MLAALSALRAYRAEHLREESAQAMELGQLLAKLLDPQIVHHGLLGPTIGEDDVLTLLGPVGEERGIVPCEASTAVAMVLLMRRGIATVTTHGQPGARVSLRLKPARGEIAKAGGAAEVAHAAADAVSEAREIAAAPDRFSELLVGSPAATR